MKISLFTDRISKSAKQLCMVYLLTGLASRAGAQTTEWVYHKTADGQHPDGNEQQMLWLLNRARANPTAEGEFLAATGNADVNSSITFFNVNVPLMKSEFAALPVTPPAAFDRRMYEGSRVHSLDMIARDSQDHNGQIQRVADAGFSAASSSYSVFAFSRSAIHAHAALNIDWGNAPDGMQPGRGHRAAIMGNFPNVGFALVPESNAGTSVGPLVFSGAYAQANTGAANHYNRFLLGTVWTDTNSNNRYDPGEGMNNVRVQPASGTWHAVTGAGGGWAFPAAAAGNFTLTFSGGTIATPETRSVAVGSVSAMVDLKITAQPAAAFTLQSAREANGNLLLTWTGGTAPFQVQRSTTLANGSWQNVGGTTSNRSMSVTPPGNRVFYRVLESQ